MTTGITYSSSLGRRMLVSKCTYKETNFAILFHHERPLVPWILPRVLIQIMVTKCQNRQRCVRLTGYGVDIQAVDFQDVRLDVCGFGDVFVVQ